ncbi:MAG: DUF4214 domain-containing protein [Burkholderiaceae bacterium]|nr:DUF4214 domain-containing protein [Burkholderiaceae bacterium]
MIATPEKTVIVNPISGDYRIDVLLASESERWNYGQPFGTPTTVTFSFMSAFPSYADEEDSYGFTVFNSEQRAATREILKLISQQFNITFKEVADTAASFGSIRLGNNYQVDSSGYANYPDTFAPFETAGDVYLNNPDPHEEQDIVPGSFDYDTIVHELLHALGLKHPGNYNAGDGPSVEAGNYLGEAEDNASNSIMSYIETPTGQKQVRDFLGNFDYLAMKYLYGARPFHSGDNNYVYDNSIGKRLSIINDTGGTDTINASAVTFRATIDLNPGADSSIGVAPDGKSAALQNLSLTYDAAIENAIGTGLSDVIKGNALANQLTGGGGNDTIDGGAGTDTLIYAGKRADFSVVKSSTGFTIKDKAGAEGTDRVSDIEKIQFQDTALSMEYSDVVQALYLGYFGRAADYFGLANFQAQLARIGGPRNVSELSAAYDSNSAVRDLINSFNDSAESNALYNGGTVKFVGAIYQNILNRDPDPEGAAFWSGAIDGGGLSRANASLSIMAGALGNTSALGLLDRALVNNKIAIAVDFTLALDTSAKVAAYSGDNAAAAVRDMLANISSATDLAAFQSDIADTIEHLGQSGPNAMAAQDATMPTLTLIGLADTQGLLL